MNKEVVFEAVKELLRVVVLAIIPLTIDALSAGEIDYRLIAVTGAIAGLRFIDKWLHEYGKTDNTPVKNLAEKGLTRF